MEQWHHHCLGGVQLGAPFILPWSCPPKCYQLSTHSRPLSNCWICRSLNMWQEFTPSHGSNWVSIISPVSSPHEPLCSYQAWQYHSKHYKCLSVLKDLLPEKNWSASRMARVVCSRININCSVLQKVLVLGYWVLYIYSTDHCNLGVALGPVRTTTIIAA